MKEYLLLFRSERAHDGKAPSAQQSEVMSHWKKWISGIAETGNYAGTNRLLPEGKMIRQGNVVTDGPYLEAKEMLGGYLVVKASSLDEATEIAKACPILQYGGSVEVRPLMGIDYEPTSSTFLDLAN